MINCGSPVASPGEFPVVSLGFPAVCAGGTDGAGAAAIPELTIAGSMPGDCWPKCAVLGRENMESPEPELAMAVDR